MRSITSENCPAYCPALVFQYLFAGRKEDLAYLRLREGITIQVGKERSRSEKSEQFDIFLSLQLYLHLSAFSL